MKNIKLSGIIRCLRILQSRCGKKMCIFALEGAEVNEISVLPLSYQECEGAIVNGAVVDVEVDSSSGRMFAESVRAAGGGG